MFFFRQGVKGGKGVEGGVAGGGGRGRRGGGRRGFFPTMASYVSPGWTLDSGEEQSV